MNTYGNSSMSASTSQALGPITHYNGLLFGDVTSLQADCEGALAIGGDAQFGSPGYGYDVAGAGEWNAEYTCIGDYQNDEGHPSFLLAGKVSQESTQARIHGGDLVLKSGYRSEYEFGSFSFEGTHRYEPDADIDEFFAVAKEQAAYTAHVLQQANDKTIALSDLAAVRLMDHARYENEKIATEKKILAYTIACDPQDTVTISEIDLDDFIYQYDLMVITVKARHIRFANGAMLWDGGVIDTGLPRYYDGNKIIGKIASRLVFVFPNAEEIELRKYGVIGSVIAPNATVTTEGGSLNGMLIAESLYQSGGMELHSFQMAMADNIFDLRIDEPLGELEIRKQNADGTLGLSGAVFDLYEYDGAGGYAPVALDKETDGDGCLVFEDLPAGIYKLVESKPPRGYVLPGIREWTVELAIDNEGELIPLDILYIKNILARGSVSLIKQDGDDHKIKLSGAEFSLYVWNDEDDCYDLVSAGHVTGADGELEISDLLPAKYKLVETAAPSGYFLPEDYEIEFAIELDTDGEIKVLEPIDVDNQKLASVEIVKRDAEVDTKTLEGAVFSLYLFNTDSDQFELVTAGLTTDASGVLTLDDLNPGHYKLTETTAPNGYYLDDAEADTFFTIEIENDGRLTQLEPIDVLNKELGKIQIYKVDSESDETLLEGAEFVLYQFNDETDAYEVLRTGLVSGADGGLLIEGLEPGKYKLTEVKAPKGYVLPVDPDTLFTITL